MYVFDFSFALSSHSKKKIYEDIQEMLQSWSIHSLSEPQKKRRSDDKINATHERTNKEELQ